MEQCTQKNWYNALLYIPILTSAKSGIYIGLVYMENKVQQTTSVLISHSLQLIMSTHSPLQKPAELKKPGTISEGSPQRWFSSIIYNSGRTLQLAPLNQNCDHACKKQPYGAKNVFLDCRIIQRTYALPNQDPRANIKYVMYILSDMNFGRFLC